MLFQHSQVCSHIGCLIAAEVGGRGGQQCGGVGGSGFSLGGS